MMKYFTFSALFLFGSIASALAQPAFLPNERTEITKSDRFGDIERRIGLTPEGLYYTIYKDGEATISRSTSALDDPDWKIKCTINKMNDAKECWAKSLRGSLIFDFDHSATLQRVCVTGHDYPGRTAMIRASKNKPITTATNGCVRASRVLKQLLTSDTVATRRIHWPYSEGYDTSGSIIGLATALDLVKYVRANLR